MWRQTRSDHRNHINRARRDGTRIVFDDWDRLGEWVAVYHDNMRRVGASSYYFFTREHLAALHDAVGDRMHLAVALEGDEVVGGNTFFEHDGIATGYVSSTRRARNRYADELLYDEVRRWCKDRGDTVFHLGGGKGGSNDSLFSYKAGFSPGRHPFHTWRVVADPDAYRAAGRRPPARRRSGRPVRHLPALPLGARHAHHLHRRRPRRPVLRGAGEAGRPRTRDHRAGTQPGRRHVRLGRGLLGRPARRPVPLRPGQRRAGSRDAACRWDEYEVRATGKAVTHLAGYGFSLGRRELLDILAARAAELGVEIRYRDELTDLADCPDADLVVACDGAGSRIRDQHAEHFGAEIEVGRNKYIWLGTPHVFDTFTFGFEQTPAGWIWYHAYPFNARDQHLHRGVRAGDLDRRWGSTGWTRSRAAPGWRRSSPAHLGGQPLIDHRAEVGGTGWLNYRRLTNQRWDHGNVVLMGDAAHTTHFAIGSGTKLAMQDAMALADAVSGGDDLAVALERYEHRPQDRAGPAATRGEGQQRMVRAGAGLCGPAGQAVLVRAVEPARRVSDCGGTCCTWPRRPAGRGRCCGWP